MKFTLPFLLIFTAITTHATPLTLMSEGKVVSVDCQIGDAKETCLLDTGASNSSLRSDFDVSKLTRLQSVKSKAIRHENENCALYEVPKVSALAQDLTNFKMQKCEGDGSAVGNVIGLSFLKKPFVLDLVDKDFHWGKQPVDERLQMLRVMPQGHLIIDASLGGIHQNALFDTGSAASAVDYEYASQHPEAFEFVGLSQNIQIDANGHPFRTFLFRAIYLNIGGKDLSGRVFNSWNFGDLRDYLGADVPVILGLNDMMGTHWFFDVEHRRYAVW